MIEKIIEYSARNRIIILMMFGLIIAWGVWSVYKTPVDAIPDLSDNQVIVFTEYPGRSPQVVEDQVTYPLAVNLQGLPQVRAVRASSAFGFSMVFVVFKDDVDYYWARSRVLERINVAQQRLPQGVTPVLGPDATALGQIYWYTVEGEGFDLAELRSIQDWFVRYQLNTVQGVAEVASIGGYVREYQIDLVTSAPTVVYEVATTDGNTVYVDNPAKLPPPDKIGEIREPIAAWIATSNICRGISSCILSTSSRPR